MNSSKLLDPLVFGGGTMLRLCHELNRYSVDLDFWFLKKTDEKEYFDSLKKTLSGRYELTDAWIKHHTILFEFRSKNYPMRLKIEIRKGISVCDWQEKIAFSKYGTRQVLLKAHTMEQTMKNKIAAALDRKEMRDFFDIEFLARRGIAIEADKITAGKLIDIIKGFKDNDYKTKLGGLLEPDYRKYYIDNKFAFVVGKLTTLTV